MPNVIDLGRLVKAKYPDYAKMDDAEVGRLVRDKYPDYKTFENVPAGAEKTGLPGPALVGGAAMQEVDAPSISKAIADVTVGALGGGVLGVGAGLAGVARAAGIPGAETAAKTLKRYAEPPQWVQEAGARPDRWMDPAFISNLAFQGAGSSLGSLVPGLGAAGAVGKVVGRIPTPVLRAAATAAAGTTVGAFFETLTDAGDQYNEAVDKHGASPEVAAQLFTETVKRELPVTLLTEIPEFLPGAAPGIRRALQVGYRAVSEGVQEVAQGVAQRTAQNKVLGTNTPMMEGAPEEFVGGILGGGLVAGGRAVAARVAERSQQAQPATGKESLPVAETKPAENVSGDAGSEMLRQTAAGNADAIAAARRQVAESQPEAFTRGQKEAVALEPGQQPQSPYEPNTAEDVAFWAGFETKPANLETKPANLETKPAESETAVNQDGTVSVNPGAPPNSVRDQNNGSRIRKESDAPTQRTEPDQPGGDAEAGTAGAVLAPEEAVAARSDEARPEVARPADPASLADAAADALPSVLKLQRRQFADAVQQHGRWEQKLLEADAAGRTGAATLAAKMVDKYAAPLREHLGESFVGPLTAAEIRAERDTTRRERPYLEFPPVPGPIPAVEAVREKRPTSLSMASKPEASAEDAKGLAMRRPGAPVSREGQKLKVFPPREKGMAAYLTQADAVPSEMHDGVLHANQPFMELYTAFLNDTAREGERKYDHPDRLAGQATSMAGAFAARLRELGRMDAMGPQETAFFNRLADQAESAQRDGVLIVVRDGQEIDGREVEKIVRHEMFHREQIRLAHPIDGTWDVRLAWPHVVLGHPAMDRAAYVLIHKFGYQNDDRILALESPAWIAGGHWTQVGLNRRQAVSALVHYLDVLEEKHGKEKLVGIVSRIDPTLRRLIDERNAKRSERSATRNARGGRAIRASGTGPQGLDARGRPEYGSGPGSESADAPGEVRQGVPGRRGGSTQAGVRPGVSAERRRTQGGKLSTDAIPGAAAAAKAAQSATDRVKDAYDVALKPLIERIRDVAPDLARKIEHARDVGDVLAGNLVARVSDAKIQKLSREDRFNLLDVLEGVAQPANAAVEAAAKTIRGVTDQVAGLAHDLGVKVRGRGGVNDFMAMSNYFPHVFRRAEALKSGPVRADILENLVRRKVAANTADAGAMLDEFVDYLESGKRPAWVIEWLVRSGQVRNEAEAYTRLQEHKRSTRRHGNIEYARDLDLPFYDPDPLRVLPWHAASSGERLAQIAEFGQEDEVIHAELARLMKNPDASVEQVREWVERVFKGVSEAGTKEERFSRWIRATQMMKLGMAFIANGGQAIMNVAPASGFDSLLAGYRALFSERGRRFAVESGAAIEPVLGEGRASLADDGWFGKSVEWFLRPFQLAEQHNRVVAANAGAHFAQRLHAIARAANPKLPTRKAKWAAERLRELGIDPTKAKLEPADIQMAAKKFSDLTQFRSRPENLPSWASTWWGKILAQFKTFGYMQTRFLLKLAKSELKSGGPMRFSRLLAVIAATSIPLGEIVRLLRNFVNGREDDAEGFDRIAKDIAAIGSLGALADLAQAVQQGRVGKWLMGPSVSMAEDVSYLIRDVAEKDADEALGSAANFYRKHGPLGAVVVSGR